MYSVLHRIMEISTNWSIVVGRGGDWNANELRIVDRQLETSHNMMTLVSWPRACTFSLISGVHGWSLCRGR